ncbi:MAG: 5-formyltetrahydrofolate cyclo-ligase [Methylocystis sp.]
MARTHHVSGIINNYMKDDKQFLRRHSLARRDLVTHEEAHQAAQELAKNSLSCLKPIIALYPSTNPLISLYWPIRSEINTRPLIDALSLQGHTISLPIMHRVKQPLVFRKFEPGDELVKGPYGLSEPADNKALIEPDIIFAPLAAFDRRGFRLGYGGGIYDATFTKLRNRKNITAIGLAYALQEIDQVPTEPHDQRLDYLITEREIISFS